MAGKSPHIGLFVTCLVDLMRPSVGFAAVKLLQAAGFAVTVPAAQTCCGQPAYNSGDDEDARAIARRVIAAFEGFDYLVAPSGSCAGTIKVHYPRLFAGDTDMAKRAEDLARRTHELTSFLSDFMQVTDSKAEYRAKVTYHDTCSGLRELAVKTAPRALLGRVQGVELAESEGAETCCGFGGTFCVKYPDISGHMVDAKADDVIASGAAVLLGGDLGCLLNIAGRLKRRGAAVGVRHVVEVLAGMTGGPAIGEGEGEGQG